MSMPRLSYAIRAVLACTVLLLNACATIHFENGEINPDPMQLHPLSPEKLSFGLFESSERLNYSERDSLRYRRWYHHALFQMAELSNPVELDRVCRGLTWNTVTTEVTPIDAVFGLLDNALLYNASSAGLDLWALWSVEYSCRP